MMIPRALTILLVCVLIGIGNAGASPVKVLGNAFVPMAIFADGRQQTRLEVVLDTGGVRLSSVVAITLTDLLVDGTPTNSIQLWDDGTHGDRVAEDYVFTRGRISVPEDFSITHPLKYRDGRVDIVPFFNRLNIQYGDPVTFESIPYDSNSGPTLGIVNSDYRVTVYNIASDIRMSDRVVNIQVDTPYSDSFLSPDPVTSEGTVYNRILRRFYTVFQDDYDFIFMLPQSTVPGTSARYTIVTNSVQGIGLETGIDLSRSVGSEGRLKGVARLSLEPNGPFLQMIMRQWGVYLSPEFGFGEPIYEDSWGLSGANGILGGFDPATVRDNLNGTVDVAFFQPGGLGDSKSYSSLEMYLAGMLPAESVAPVPVIRNGTIESLGHAVTIRVGSMETVSIDRIIAVHGPRLPAYEASQKDFRAAFIALSTHPFEESELAYFNAVAEHITRRDSNSETSFFQATHGEGTLDTILGFFKEPSLAVIRVPRPTPTAIPGDINNDGRIQLSDLVKLGRAWREGGYKNRRLDLNGDGVMDEKDLLILLGH